MNFKLYFKQLKLYQKVELYLLIIMFYGSMLYFYSDTFHTQPINIVKHKNINDFKNKIIKKDQLFFIKYIEQNIKEYNLFSNSIKIDKNYINLSIDGKFANIINFIKELETHLIIKQIILKKSDKNISATLTIKIKYFYNTLAQKQKDIKIPNPFLTIKEKTTSKKITLLNKNVELNLTAIIGDIVYINTKQYKLYDKIDGYKIIKIDLSSVTLKKNNSYLTLRLYDEK